MPLSEKTIAEMRAGAAQLAAHAGKYGIDPEYMEGILRTQQRASWLQGLEREGRVKIERQIRPRTNDKLSGPDSVTVVKVGDNAFTDPSGELIGAWPSEVLVAQVAMALAAGEDEKSERLILGGTGIVSYCGVPVDYYADKMLYRTRDGRKTWTAEEWQHEVKNAVWRP